MPHSSDREGFRREIEDITGCFTKQPVMSSISRTPPKRAADDDPRQVVADALGSVTNNRERMDYPRDRRLGPPVVSAPVASTITQRNHRVKGSEKCWLSGGAEAVLHVRAAYLSQDGRAERWWAPPRPDARAVGSGRLRSAA